MNFIIREYKKNDEIGIMSLDNSLLSHKWNKRNLSNWYWKYKSKISNSIIIVAEYKKKIIGHFAVIPIYYSINKKKILSSHSIGLMIAKKWQSRGLVKFLSEKLFYLTEKNNINQIYGFPNKLALKLHTLLFNYKLIEMINILNFKYSYKYKYKKIDSNFKIEKIKKFNKLHDIFFQNNLNRYKVFLYRNSNFLNWRYLARPDKEYFAFNIYEKNQLMGYCILKLYKENKILKGHILDFFTINKKVVQKNLIFFCMNFLKFKGADLIDLFIKGDKVLENIFREQNFKIINKVPLVCKFSNNSKKANKLFNKANWFMTQGDSLEIY